MRLGIKPEGILESIVLKTGIVPTPLMHVFWGMSFSRTIIAGIKLEIFEILENGEKSVSEIAKVRNYSEEALETVLNALTGFQYLNRKNGKYSNAPIVKKWLLKSSKNSMLDSILFIDSLREIMDNIEEAVITGKKSNFHHMNKPPEFWEHYLRGLAGFAKYTAKEIVSKSKLSSSAKKLLDVGGGHGGYSIAFCKKFPGLKAEILDLPEAVKVGKAIVQEQGFQSQINFREGDLRFSEWGENFDIILIFNVIHNISPDESLHALKKAYDSLNNGGIVMILESEYNDSTEKISQTAGFNELMFLLTSGTRVYPESQIKEWMNKSGFSNIRTKRLLTMPMTCILTGRKI